MAVAILATLPFARSLTGTFVFDDHSLIEEREAVHSLSRLPELLRGEFWEGLSLVHFHYVRPLVSASYALDWAMWGANPFGFHVTNLLLHGAVTALLYAMLCRVSRAPWGALVAVLAWAWHPSKVEAVSWISGRTDLLCALGILVVCSGVHRRLSGAPKVGLSLELAGLAIALGSKEHAVVIPAFVAVEAWAHFAHARATPLELRDVPRVLMVALPYTAIVLVYLAVRALVFPIAPSQAGSLSLLDGRLYSLETFGELGNVMLRPWHYSILRAPIRYDSALRFIHSPARLAAGAGLVLVTTTALALTWKRPQARWRTVGVVLFAAALFPVANVLPTKMVFLFAERFAYLPLIGVALALVPARSWRPDAGTAGGSMLTRGNVLAWASVLTWGAVLTTFAVLSMSHTGYFLDDRRLWEHELVEDPTEPLPLRWACEQALREHRNRDALALALRGYKASAGWPISKPERVDFATKGAHALELVTLDADRGTLEQVAQFFGTLLSRQGVARIKTPSLSFTVDAARSEADEFRRGPQGANATLWAATASARAGQCAAAVSLARTFLSLSKDAGGRFSAALVLARCESTDQALAIASSLPPNRSTHELTENLAWIKALSERPAEGLEGALERSRARTMLLDRAGALEMVLPYRDALVKEPEGALQLAHLAWSAGQDDVARGALAVHLPPDQSRDLLATWSRELGREP